MTDPAVEYAALLARAAPYLRRPTAVVEAGFGRVAVTDDPWLRAAAEPYLQDGLPDLPLSPAEMVDALVLALAELAAEAGGGPGLRRAAWDPAKHPRGPGGRFLSTVDSLKDSIRKHRAGGRGGDPFDGFDREQLRRAAKARGITLARGESRESIAEKLLADLDPAPAVAADLPAGPKRTSKYHGDLDSVSELENTVENEYVVRQEALTGGAMGETRLVTYANGQQVVRKESRRQIGHNSPAMQADAEQLSSLVGRALGLQSPRVYRSERDRETIVHMEYVADAEMPAYLVSAHPLQVSDEGRVVALMDHLILNGDRHSANWFIKDGRIVPIDNGLAFDKGYFDDLRSGWSVPWGHFNEDDMAEVRQRMEALQPDFERLGRGEWHKEMMDRVESMTGLAHPDGPSRLPAAIH